ncbi:tripartite tricarboxylate transporter substrate binding protein [Polynucleobacter sp. UK-Kesae-W10]|uniref:Bug family tripartite tricarboxylate transporter substrate binding protein n=1 Tax=Polynucleobacter sp. UK-Kesae-W10 TaxID=1819738 RepID=UPI001C0DE4CB|nr:tripartite tricarboxylate transporter substrate binding protein [Polynucleobacter sp. UK-Kesae-W10]MBU3578309.1 tripartite tricarboxylate transporter substrate binding protein [Polynucleobacter sp. UK-Kesae-W10]
MKIRQLLAYCLSAYLGLLGPLALADTYPSKPIKAIVPFAPGSATDQIGRAFAAKMAESLGQPVVVENRPGANGMIGADVVAKSPADGYTLLFGTNSTNAALKSLVKNLPYNQDTAFVPIGYFGSVPLIVAINNDVPAKSLNGFVSLAKADPGKMTFAYASTSQRVSSEILASAAGIKMTGVSYKSGPNAMTDLIGGQVNMFTADFAVTLPQVQAGKIRGLAVTSLKRSPAIPELPTVNEALGIKNYELIAFFAAFGPAGMPKDVVLKLNKAINDAAKSKELKERFASLGFETQPGTPEALGQKIKLETAKWAQAIKAAGMEPE